MFMHDCYSCCCFTYITCDCPDSAGRVRDILFDIFSRYTDDNVLKSNLFLNLPFLLCFVLTILLRDLIEKKRRENSRVCQKGDTHSAHILFNLKSAGHKSRLTGRRTGRKGCFYSTE